MAVTSDNLTMEHLRNFLYLGTHLKLLHPSFKYPFDPVNDQYLDTLINEGLGQEVVQEILRFYRDGYFLTLDALTYSLAFCAHSKDVGTRKAAFQAAEEICKEASQMFAFVRFYKDISKPKSGWGRAQRTFLINWYNGKDAKDLAAEILKVRERHKWTHKDILCLTHVKPKSTATSVVLRYILKGIETTERDFGSESEAGDVLLYLKGVHQLKHTTDNEAAARLIEIHNLTFQHLPSVLLSSKEVWMCLIPRLPLNVLLEKLPHLNKLGFLKLNSPHYKLLMERLTCENVHDNGAIGPLESYAAIRKWQQANKGLPGKSAVQQNTPALDEALQNLHLSSFKTVPTTEKKYLVALDLPLNLIAKQCTGCNVLTPSHVTGIVLMALLRAELSNVTALAYSFDGLIPVDVNNKMTLTDIAQRFDKISPGPVNPSAPLHWAIEKKKAFDLILIFTSYQPIQTDDDFISTLKEYRRVLNLPNARLIVCSLCTGKEIVNPTFDESGFLSIEGFNMKLLKIIQDFALGVF